MWGCSCCPCCPCRRRDAMVSLMASYVAQPTMPLRELFTNIVDLLYKVRGCEKSVTVWNTCGVRRQRCREGRDTGRFFPALPLCTCRRGCLPVAPQCPIRPSLASASPAPAVGLRVRRHQALHRGPHTPGERDPGFQTDQRRCGRAHPWGSHWPSCASAGALPAPCRCPWPAT